MTMVLEREFESKSTFIQPVDSVETVIGLIKNWIDHAALKQGDRLPTERALSEQFALNRNLVRRAFARLEASGLIHRHVGRGTFVGAPVENAIKFAAGNAEKLTEHDYSPAAILQTRLIIEPNVAALVTANATPTDFRAFEQLLLQISNADNDASLVKLDIDFFVLLGQAAHNLLLASISEAIAAARRRTEWAAADRATLSPTLKNNVTNGLERCFFAITRRQADAAAKAVREMLHHSARGFSILAQMELLPEF